jgi:hypothetical protein
MTKSTSQAEKFKQAARELETDNDPEKFDRKMRGLKLETKKPPKAEKKKPSR